MTTIILHFFLLVYLLKLVVTEDACFHVIGELRCSSNRLKHRFVRIELFDEDVIADEIMGMTYSQENGSFSIFGCGRDPLLIDYPDPYLRITHNCKFFVRDNRFKFKLRQVFMPETLNVGIIELDNGDPVAAESEKMEAEETPEIIFKYEMLDNFDDINFGCFKNGAGYSQDVEVIAEKTLPSIPLLICSTVKYGLAAIFERSEPKFKNFYAAYDDGDKLVFVRGEIQHELLNNGKELSSEKLKYFRPYQIPGDSTTQLIPTNLGGGDSCENAFNLNEAAKIKKWRNALEKCYKYLETDQSNSVRFIYVMSYPIEEFRPSEIFYHFKFYSNNGEKAGESIDGKINNGKQR